MYKSEETEVKLHEIILIVKYTFSEGEERTHDYPGSPTIIELDEVYIEKTDIFDLLSYDQQDEIIDLIKEQMTYR